MKQTNMTYTKGHGWGIFYFEGISQVPFLGGGSPYFQTKKILILYQHGPLARYVNLRVAHAPGMPGTFSPPPRVSDPDMHHVTCVTHVPWCIPGSLTSGFLWSRWQAKRSRYSQRIRNTQFYVFGTRPIERWLTFHRMCKTVGALEHIPICVEIAKYSPAVASGVYHTPLCHDLTLNICLPIHVYLTSKYL